MFIAIGMIIKPSCLNVDKVIIFNINFINSSYSCYYDGKYFSNNNNGMYCFLGE